MTAALRGSKGVRDVRVDFDRQQAYVLCDKAKADPKPLLAAIEKAGYGGSFVRYGAPAADQKN